MSAPEIAPGVIRLGNRFVNWWLVLCEDGAVIVDAGLRGHLEQLNRCLKERGLSLGDIDACLLTHADVDHIGVAEHLRRAGVRVLIHPDDERPALGAARPLPEEMIANLHVPYLRQTAETYAQEGGMEPEFLSSTSALGDGTQDDIPGRPLSIHCPGHTPGSCAFYFSELDVLFTGDAIITVDVVTGEPGPQLLPEYDNADLDQAKGSVSRLRETEARLVLTGHGEPWADGIAAAVDQALE
jgi:glyoxylase-like metal-dependent hydrolase (beta-lactamase superfamily II)